MVLLLYYSSSSDGRVDCPVCMYVCVRAWLIIAIISITLLNSTNPPLTAEEQNVYSWSLWTTGIAGADHSYLPCIIVLTAFCSVIDPVIDWFQILA